MHLKNITEHSVRLPENNKAEGIVSLRFTVLFNCRIFVCVVISRSAGYLLLRTELRRRITIAQARLAGISNAIIPMMLP